MRAGFNGDFGPVSLRANAVQWAVARAHALWHEEEIESERKSLARGQLPNPQKSYGGHPSSPVRRDQISDY
jgi:hypothetical protein